MSEENINDANNIEGVVDHHSESLKKEQTKVAEDILETLRENIKKDIPLKFSIEQIETNYNIKEIPTVDIKASLWYQMTKDEKIGSNIQGHRQTVKDGKRVRIPYIAMGADLEYLDEMMKRIITKVLLSKEYK
jgi:hypothetical protein|tara:strand:+ start:75 stop:473 length:399 start_codon:yes stop_codon:yes gene_type:complete